MALILLERATSTHSGKFSRCILEEAVNTNSETHLASMLHMQIGNEPIQDCPQKSAYHPRLHDMAEQFLPDVDRDYLEMRLNSMQETFMALLSQKMTTANLSFTERLHIFIGEGGRLIIEGSDNDTDKLGELLSTCPEIQLHFYEMAALAMLVHGLDIVCRAHASLLQTGGNPDAGLLGRYHMCLKGSLSHFYVR